jgi:arginyl-tRNA synthetase
LKDYKREIAELLAALDQIKNSGLSEQDVYDIIEEPKDDGLGDFAFPCFRLSKALSKAPTAIAAELAEALGSGNATGPYLNFFVDRSAFGKDVLTDVLTKGARYGSSDIGKNKRVLVEFSSPNIAKPFHIGHIRSTVIGSSIGKILSFLGYEVIRLNHLGDYGTQFGKLIVAYKRFGNRKEVEASPIQTLLRYYVEFHKQAEKDPSLEVEARAAFAALERGEEAERELWEWFREESLKEFTVVYDMMGIAFDSYAGESFYSDKMERFLEELGKCGLLETSDGAKLVDLEAFGLGKALIQKSDGSTLYITRDIAAAVYRKEHYGFCKNIYVVASQQDLHFKQWIKILELMGYEWASDCIHIPFGLVRLEDGAMQTRTGNVVFLEDVLRQAIDKTNEIIEEKGVVTEEPEKAAEQIGIGAVVYQELSNNRIKDYVFSWDKVLSFDGETGPYVQYGHARASSVLRKAAELELEVSPAALLSAGSFAAAETDSAFALIKLIGSLPGVIIEAGKKYEPSLITRHVTDIAQAFSVFYHEEPILSDEGDSRLVKLAVTAAAKQAIKNGLALIGVSAPERM